MTHENAEVNMVVKEVLVPKFFTEVFKKFLGKEKFRYSRTEIPLFRYKIKNENGLKNRQTVPNLVPKILPKFCYSGTN